MDQVASLVGDRERNGAPLRTSSLMTRRCRPRSGIAVDLMLWRLQVRPACPPEATCRRANTGVAAPSDTIFTGRRFADNLHYVK
jgi:hypothetical protein